jgi:hypothetical protein
MIPNRTRPLGQLQSADGENYVSVSDESSPDARSTGRSKVPIFAQVLGDRPLDWFYDLRFAFPHVPGELKGSVVVTQFESLPAETRRRIWNGLRDVRIHITDPRPYLRERDHIYRNAVGVPFPLAELKERARAGDPTAKYLLSAGDDLVGHLILSDSRPARLARAIVIADDTFGFMDHAHDYAKPLGLDLKEELHAIRAGQQSLVTRAAALACKSGSVFTDAHDAATHADIDEGDFRFDTVRRLARNVVNRLRDRHAFDRGDEKLLGRVQKMRDSLGRRLEDMADPFARLERFSLESTTGCASAFAEPLATVESVEVTEAQAADVAARMAAAIYEREGLHGVVKRFGYVVFNGARVTERNVGEHLRRWNAMGN